MQRYLISSLAIPIRGTGTVLKLNWDPPGSLSSSCKAIVTVLLACIPTTSIRTRCPGLVPLSFAAWKPEMTIH